MIAERIVHRPFVCGGCGATLNGMVPAEPRDELPMTGDYQLVTLCGYCGIVYAAFVDYEALRRGEDAGWAPLPPEKMDDYLRGLSADVKAGTVRVAGVPASRAKRS